VNLLAAPAVVPALLVVAVGLDEVEVAAGVFSSDLSIDPPSPVSLAGAGLAVVPNKPIEGADVVVAGLAVVPNKPIEGADAVVAGLAKSALMLAAVPLDSADTAGLPNKELNGAAVVVVVVAGLPNKELNGAAVVVGVVAGLANSPAVPKMFWVEG